MERLIFHVDVNSAFLSWEAARRVASGEEDIRLVPSAVGGAPEKRTGVILAKSIPAKAFGVRTGEPVAAALRKCPGLLLAPPDFGLYERSSPAFMDLCRRCAPVVEKYSIDECFLDMTGTGRLYPDPIAAAHELKNQIRDTLGFTVNIGIARNKLLAKMASDFEKPDRVHTLFPWELAEKLWPLPVGELFSVGRATAEKLVRYRIRTIGDLAQAEPKRIQTLIGEKTGAQLQAYANGEDETPVLENPREAKGYSVSTTLEEDVTTAEGAQAVLLALADSLTARMRADRTRACCIAVTLRSNDFRDRNHQMKLQEPTDITSEVYRLACRLFSELWDGRTPLRLLGISLTQLVKEDSLQLSLFRDERREKARKLDRAVDAIRETLGFDIIRRGTLTEAAPNVARKYRGQLENRRRTGGTGKNSKGD